MKIGLWKENHNGVLFLIFFHDNTSTIGGPPGLKLTEVGKKVVAKNKGDATLALAAKGTKKLKLANDDKMAAKSSKNNKTPEIGFNQLFHTPKAPTMF